MKFVPSFNSQSCVRALRRFSISHLMVLALLLLGAAFLTSAQEATIVGTVTDPSGSVVPNVTVTITNTKTGAVRTMTTNDVGQYVAPGLSIGTYDLKAESSGFKVEESKGVLLNVNDRVRVDFQMKMGTKAETVSVESNAIAVQTDSSEVSSLSTGTQMSELATNGRSIYTYVILTPGAANLMPSFQAPTSVGANANVSLTGTVRGTTCTCWTAVRTTIAGRAARRASRHRSTPLQRRRRSLRTTAPITGFFRRDDQLGGKVWHQGVPFFVVEFFRNNDLDARNYFNPAPQEVAELRYNLYGFNVGGPVTFGKLYNPNKTKTFFFYNMEWRSLIQGQTLNVTVPEAAFYGGNFSTAGYSLSQLHAPAVCQVSAAIQAQFAAAGQTLSGCTNGAPDPTKEVAFNNNTIPASLLNSNAQALLTAGGKYGGIFPAPNNGAQFQRG